MQRHRRIILLVEATSAYGRGCLHGIARYARVHGGWIFYHRSRYVMESLKAPELRAWKADGVVARIENKATVNLIRKLNLPTVDIRGTIKVPGVARMTTDDGGVIQLAADHLISSGIRHLAFCGLPGVDFSDNREAVFKRMIPEAHVTRHVFAPATEKPRKPGSLSRLEKIDVPDWALLLPWLRALPKPVGIIACNDRRGRQILEICAAADIKVPYEVSVVGVDNDDVLCDLAFPTMTSVVPNVETIGFDAARLLDEMIGGKKAPREPIFVAPTAIEVRESSDMTALSDPTLIEAVRIIRNRLGEGINVKQLLREVHVSRSTFERQFHEYLGCTPYEYILRLRIDRVRQLLLDTNFPIARITRLAGFRGPAHMTAVFRQRTGQTPAQFRQANPR